MLRFVLGRSFADKTEYVRSLVAERVNSGEDGYVIIVPEQFSYDTEKSMLEKVGAAGMQKLEVLSLTRLAQLILSESGLLGDRPAVDRGVKLLIMSMALEELSDRLVIFRRYSTRPALTESIVSLATELKQCSVSVEELSEYASGASESSLKNKLEELTLIITTYNAMLEESYYDTDDNLTRLSGALEDYKYFENKTVVIDGFTRFTKQETGVVRQILSQADDVYMTFNADPSPDSESCPQFENINAQIRRISNIAAGLSVETAEPIVIDESTENIDSAILDIERNVFNPFKRKDCAATSALTLYSADNKADECDFVAMSIKKLLRENKARCRDIIVYQRDKGGYDSELVSAFRRYGVPFYEDRRQPVEAQPLMIFVCSLLELVCSGITTEVLMRYLKTGLTSLESNEIDELENYSFIWKIKTSQWKNSFTENPDGFGREMHEPEFERLKKLNSYRVKAITPVLEFKDELTAAVGSQKAEVLYNFLERYGVARKLKELSARLADSDDNELFNEQNAVWGVLMDMLDKLYIAVGDAEITNKRFYDLFSILLSVADLGTLPSGLDSVTIALADRTRTGLRRYGFIVGANDGVFPKTPSTEGLLNDNDRNELKKAGIELAETAQYKSFEEQYIAYCALTCASDGLFVSYCLSDYKGTGLPESEIVTELKSVFPTLRVLTVDDIDPIDRIESKASAFSQLALLYGSPTPLTASIEEYFESDPVYSGRVETLKGAFTKSEKRIKDSKIATELFGKNIYLSASKAESYSSCPFKFFCNYGLKAEPRKEAKVDNLLSGTIIHYVFEKLLTRYDKNQLVSLTDGQIEDGIRECLNEYLDTYMGGSANKSKRFLSSYFELVERLKVLFKRIAEEFRNCEFEPVACELAISYDGDIAPYELKLEDGGSLFITGKVDRVDMMRTETENYMRIVDYKSSGKDFHLYDVLNGFNMQMLIYLFTIYTNGTEKFGDFVPCGILYMPAKDVKPDLDRNADEAKVSDKELHSHAMTGVVIDEDTVLRGMEKELKGYFIPVKLEKGKLKGNFISRKAMMRLKDEVDGTLRAIADGLHQGIIRVLPEESACKYCDFKAVCCFENGDPILELPEMTDAQAKSKLESQEVDENG